MDVIIYQSKYQKETDGFFYENPEYVLYGFGFVVLIVVVFLILKYFKIIK